MNFRKNLYFSCKHCGRDSYIDDTKIVFVLYRASKKKISLNASFKMPFNRF